MRKWKHKSALISILLIFLSLIFISAQLTEANTKKITPADAATTPPAQAVPAPSGSTTAQKDEDKKIEDKEENIGKFLGKEGDDSVIAKNVELSRVNGKTTVKFNSRGSLRVKTPDGKYIELSELGKLEGVKKDGKELSLEPQIIFNEKGEIIGSYFTTGKDGEYVFGNQKISLKKGVKVFFEPNSNKVNLGVAENTQLSAPMKIDSSKSEELTFSYQAPGKGSLYLNNYKFQGAVLNYEKGDWFFNDKDVKIDENVFVRRVNEAKTYLDFNGQVSGKYQGAYISFNKEAKTFILGTNTNEEGPAVMFSANNPYGIKLEQGDHFAIKVLGDGKQNYAILTDRDRSSKDLIPQIKTLGSVAVNQDNSAIGSYLKDGNMYKRIGGVFITEFPESAGKGFIPVEIDAYKLVDGKEVPISTSSILTAPGKRETIGNKFLVSNRGEFGWGPNPVWISGRAYKEGFPLLARGISNRISYNYVQYTADGFRKYTGLRLSMDSYSQSRMTPDKYRLLIDFANSLTPLNKKYLQGISLVADAGGGAIAWGGPGGIRVDVDYFGPQVLRHEATHAIALASGSFMRDWQSVGGGSRALVGNSYNIDEDVAEFGWHLLYKDPKLMKRYLMDSREAKYFRGKFAVLLKHNIIDRGTFNTHFLNSGLPVDDASIQKYINEARGR